MISARPPNRFQTAVSAAGKISRNLMAKDEEDDLLPDKDAAKGFYAKYEPKEILGR